MGMPLRASRATIGTEEATAEVEAGTETGAMGAWTAGAG